MKKIYFYKTIFVMALTLFMPHTHAQNVLLISMPKTGTNLVLKFLKRAMNEQTFYQVNAITRYLYWCHEMHISTELTSALAFAPSEQRIDVLQKKGIKIILLLRDPRQHITALLRAIGKNVNAENITWGIDNFPYMITQQTGVSDFLAYQNINQCFDDYLQWTQQYPWIYTTTYEKLVGSSGGGNDQVQREEIKKIIQFLGIIMTDAELDAMPSFLYGGTPTFKEGKIDTWKQHFSEANKAHFKEKTGDLLIKLGYETDNNW